MKTEYLAALGRTLQPSTVFENSYESLIYLNRTFLISDFENRYEF